MEVKAKTMLVEISAGIVKKLVTNPLLPQSVREFSNIDFIPADCHRLTTPGLL